MQIISNYIHSFLIGDVQIKVCINCTEEGYWSCNLLEGETGTGAMCGGRYKDLKEYITEVERSHRYSFYFYGHSGEQLTRT